MAAAQLSAPHWQLAICGPPLPPNTDTAAAHTHDDGGTGRPTFQQVGLLDKDFISIMSYQDDAPWNETSWDPATPMAADILALQYLY